MYNAIADSLNYQENMIGYQFTSSTTHVCAASSTTRLSGIRTNNFSGDRD
jgi:hypothetical protein